jgi:hypothetical protein
VIQKWYRIFFTAWEYCARAVFPVISFAVGRFFWLSEHASIPAPRSCRAMAKTSD